MTPAWRTLRESLLQDGLDIGADQRQHGLRLRVDGRFTLRIFELPHRHRICLLWSGGGRNTSGGSPVPDDCAWIQSQCTDALERCWTSASHAASGTRLLASSMDAHAIDTVGFREWLGDFVDRLSASADIG